MTAKIFNCKSEEVPVIGNHLLFILKRDFTDFSTSLPRIFTGKYLADFEKKIAKVNNFLNSQAETVELKNTTNRLYSLMDSLFEPVHKMTGYIKGAIPVSEKDFGLTTLKQKLYAKDAKAVLKNLRTVVTNIEKYRPQLTEQGFDENMSALFINAISAIEADNQLLIETVNKQKMIVENNIDMFNDLYKIITEICNVGKALYRGNNASKAIDYTFSEIKKSVRIK